MPLQHLNLTSFEENQFLKGTIHGDYLVLGLHGRGDTCLGMRRNRRLFKDLHLSWLVVNAPFPWTNETGFEGFSWYLRPPLHQSGLEYSLSLLEQLIQELATMGYPREKIVLLGFSQGAVMALNLALFSSQRFAACVCISGAVLLSKELTPVKMNETPLIVTHGVLDDVIAYDTTYLDILELQSQIPKLQFMAFDKAHEIVPAETQYISRQLTSILGFSGS